MLTIVIQGPDIEEGRASDLVGEQMQNYTIILIQQDNVNPSIAKPTA